MLHTVSFIKQIKILHLVYPIDDPWMQLFQAFGIVYKNKSTDKQPEKKNVHNNKTGQWNTNNSN